ncbi:MAG: hypothetical protein NXH75_03265, partial [Halobacteriovoraceae bacterium]|nr:hypothetical protein [Halobacteriovoraceae bacterium]
VDTVSPEVTLTGLFTGSYYYIKVAALRDSPQSPKTYISDMNMNRREVIIPSDGYFYDYGEKAMISKTMTSEGGGFGTKTEAISFCGTERLLINKNGSTVSLPLQLIDSDIYDVIDSDEVNNSSYAYKAIPHWMGDSLVDISTLFTPFDCTQTSGTDGDISFYQKTCGDCSCNGLSLFIGGDGSDLPYGANVYAEGDAFDAAARCYLPQ